MKYIDAERLKAEIERRRLSNRYIDTDGYEAELLEIITSLQQEQPMPDSTKLIELWHEDREMLKEKDFRDDPWRLAYNAFMCGFGRGIAVKKQEQPEPTCKSCGFYENNCPFIRNTSKPYPNRICKDYTYSVMKEQEQQNVNLEEEMDKYYDSPLWDGENVSWMTYTRIARHFAEWGAIHYNARKEE